MSPDTMAENPFRVIISDDEPFVRLLLKKVARMAGLELVAEAENGQEALDRYRQHRPDLMLLDINMPVKSGEETLKELLKEFPDARVIVLTSMSDMETAKRCISLGAKDCILKDTPVPKIQEILVGHVERFRSAALNPGASSE